MGAVAGVGSFAAGAAGQMGFSAGGEVVGVEGALNTATAVQHRYGHSADGRVRVDAKHAALRPHPLRQQALVVPTPMPETTFAAEHQCAFWDQLTGRTLPPDAGHDHSADND